ncbi:metallo-beta-lactamase family protein [Myxococcus xanthus DK 1622]|uniref:Metallo-beta-lactamase family protein n=1 Tax=Myxococcus xanthus (strain DK1622) TaxID=246197 RepID=Q1DG79_MYXXD|nr:MULTISPECIES: MBL fold metallo-hydrolase [Myxococcus]ABF87364.1 metallo-beta-lactamase family protein [Myxococcus xanthus DK 1622]NOJ54309.1 MBL fold metallo-hydrolase [Myxococcus xanthus]QPM79801.1 MBL fold metallo-hydrolase [Myxococcus xanthus]QVW68864.1 MBL fold metallo-hydrolase [Myxococcus xanthus DZ2]QZZ47624.1 putative metallo-hydrolase [Myxococcus xanthus]
MRIHHLNCTTMCPPGGRLVDGRKGFTGPAALTCHCLLVEGRQGLILVDTGFGLEDVKHPRARLHPLLLKGIRPRLNEGPTAIRQIERMGFHAEDVRDIVLTHLDCDHAGGLSDFPHAKIHLLWDEYQQALAQATARDRRRYRPQQWPPETQWVTYPSLGDGERWFGFECVRDLTGLPPEILLVPLPGHTLGHAGVAIQNGSGWLLHAGDAYFYHGEMAPDRYQCTLGLRIAQKLNQTDGYLRWHNMRRLRELVHRHGRDVTVFCAHDSLEFELLEEQEKAPERSPLRTFVDTRPPLHA